MKWKKVLFILLSILSVIALLAVLGVGAILLSGNQITIARCIVTNGGALYMDHQGEPVLLNYGKDTACQTGDKLLIVHSSAFAESYPAQCSTSFVMKIASGDPSDVSPKAMETVKRFAGGVVTGASSIPGLQILYGEEAIDALQGGYNWTWDEGNGCFGNVIADSMHPLQTQDHVPEIPYLDASSDPDPLCATLSFDTPPTQVTVRTWKTTAWDDLNAESEDAELTALPESGQYALKLSGGTIYEICATWSSPDGTGGRVSYCFCTSDSIHTSTGNQPL